MEIEYDKESDSLYIKFKPGRAAETREVNSDTYVDYFADGTVKGIEILSASFKAFDLDNPFVVYLKNLEAKTLK